MANHTRSHFMSLWKKLLKLGLIFNYNESICVCAGVTSLMNKNGTDKWADWNVTVPPLVSCISMCTRSGSTSTPDTDLKHKGESCSRKTFLNKDCAFLLTYLLHITPHVKIRQSQKIFIYRNLLHLSRTETTWDCGICTGLWNVSRYLIDS